MAEESLSVIKIHDVLMVTVPPDPDDDTISFLQEKVLHSMEKHTARGLVLDISTVQTLDSFFARTIVETGQMVKLMGGETVITGMQPSVAITATQLGLTFDGILTALDVERGLEMLHHPQMGR